MPFTFAHPAAVLPFLKRKYFSDTALIAGSIAPDFEYFFKMEPGSEHSHTLSGLLYFDLPVSFFLAFTFHVFVRKSLLDNLPGFIKNRLQSPRHFNFLEYSKQHYLIFIYSALLGSATHLLWDSFTHGNGYMVKQSLYLVNTRLSWDGVRYPLWYALQIISSWLGLLLISIFFFKEKAEYTEKTKPMAIYWICIFLLTGTLLVLRYWLGSPMRLGSFIVSFISCSLLAFTSVGVVQTFISTRLSK